jgi:DNA-directed RNA polymerase specialized sigma24 family protein
MESVHTGQDLAIPGLSLILEGKEAGWSEFYNYYLPVVTSQVQQLRVAEISDLNLAPQDIAHDIIAKVAIKGRVFFIDMKVKTDWVMRGYFRTAVFNYRADLLRKKSSTPEHVALTEAQTNDFPSTDDGLAGWIPSSLGRPDNILELRELIEAATRMLAFLPQKLATVLRMSAAGAKHHDIAEKLGIGIKSVGSLVQRAQRCLKKELQSHEPVYFECLVSEGLVKVS